ncbi:MAG: sigma-70 family RNA polymerase sigma factor [Saprospiraceae bacterium]|nr:sigma-70 family RNA polymerase sigma factor [Saprospiraceae bacterium]
MPDNKNALNNDSHLIQAIQGDEIQRKKALQEFFTNPELFQRVVGYVISQGGSSEDAKDVFTESFIVFDRQVRNGVFRGESSLATYFQAIAKWQWLALKRKNKVTYDTSELAEVGSDQSPEKLMITSERKVILQNLIALMGEKCQRLLGLFQLNYSMKEIKEKMSYASEQVAANQVHKCREQLRNAIQEHPEHMSVLKYSSD